MAARFWVQGAGTWDNNTGNWAASSGGLPTAAAPTSSDSVTFDGNSGLLDGAVVTVASTAAGGQVNITGPALKNITFSLSGNPGTFGAVTFGGGSTQGVNRLLFKSDTPGTQRTITASSYTISGDIDFQDINLAYSGATSWTNTGSKFIGDCGGNAGAVTTNRTTPATQTATGTASFTWSTHGWTSRVPLPQDDVVIANAFVAGRTITQDMPRAGANLTMSGLTGSPTFSATGIAWSMFGNLTLGSGTHAFTWVSTTTVMTLAGRGSQTITSAGNSVLNGIAISAPGGSYTLQDDLTATGRTASVSAGTFNANGKNVTLDTVNTLSGATWTQGGAGTITCTRSSTGTAWGVSTGTTLNTMSGATILFTGVAAGITLTFVGGGKTYGTFRHNTMVNMTVAITSGNTFATLDLECATTASTLTLPASATQTVTTSITLTGTSGHNLTVNSSSPGTTTTVKIQEAASSTRSFHTLSADIAYTFLDSTTVPLVCTLTTAGVRTRLGSTTTSLTDTITTAGKLTAKSSTTTPLAFTFTTAGVRTRFGASTTTATFTITDAGKLTAKSSTTFPLVFTTTTAGVRTRFGATSSTYTFAVDTSGTRTRFGATASTYTVTRDTTGLVTAKSASTFPIVFAFETSGAKHAFSSVTMTETVDISTAGTRTTTSSVTFPITFTIATSGGSVVISGGVTGTITQPERGVLIGVNDGMVTRIAQGRLSRSTDGHLTKARIG